MMIRSYWFGSGPYLGGVNVGRSQTEPGSGPKPAMLGPKPGVGTGPKYQLSSECRIVALWQNISTVKEGWRDSIRISTLCGKRS